MSRLSQAFLLLVALASAAHAQMSADVQFEKGNYGTRVNGSITGGQYFDYKLGAGAGHEVDDCFRWRVHEEIDPGFAEEPDREAFGKRELLGKCIQVEQELRSDSGHGKVPVLRVQTQIAKMEFIVLQ